MRDEAIDILLVEDNPNDVELTLRALKKNNLSDQIKILRNGAEAIDYLFCQDEYKDRDMENIPRLILLDLKLPKVDGLEVLKKINSHPITRMITTIVLTSSSDERDINRSYALGINSYIVKPIDFKKFTEIVGHVVHYWFKLNQPPVPR